MLGILPQLCVNKAVSNTKPDNQTPKRLDRLKKKKKKKASTLRTLSLSAKLKSRVTCCALFQSALRDRLPDSTHAQGAATIGAETK